MGIYSTMAITKEDAIAEIMKKLLTASNEELEQALFAFYAEKTLHNFMIVDNYDDLDESWSWIYNGYL